MSWLDPSSRLCTCQSSPSPLACHVVDILIHKNNGIALIRRKDDHVLHFPEVPKCLSLTCTRVLLWYPRSSDDTTNSSSQIIRLIFFAACFYRAVADDYVINFCARYWGTLSRRPLKIMPFLRGWKNSLLVSSLCNSVQSRQKMDYVICDVT